VTAGTFLEHVCSAVGCQGRQSGRQIRVCADVPPGRGETNCYLWVIKQPKVVVCCPGAQAFTVRRCFAVAKLICQDAKSINRIVI